MKFIRFMFALALCGSGQILKREYFKGFLFFTGALASAGIVFLGIQSDDWVGLVLPFIGILCLVFLWIYSVVDVALNNETKKKKVKIAESLNKIYIRGLAFYLRGDYKAAAKIFKLILRKNKKDVDAIFQLANTYERMGAQKKAKKMYGKYAKFETVQN